MTRDEKIAALTPLHAFALGVALGCCTSMRSCTECHAVWCCQGRPCDCAARSVSGVTDEAFERLTRGVTEALPLFVGHEPRFAPVARRLVTCSCGLEWYAECGTTTRCPAKHYDGKTYEVPS